MAADIPRRCRWATHTDTRALPALADPVSIVEVEAAEVAAAMVAAVPTAAHLTVVAKATAKAAAMRTEDGLRPHHGRLAVQ